MIEKNAVFDAIINSEDAMLKQAVIKRSDACKYLRAHIMMRLIFCKQLVVTDSAVNLNRAFRTLVLKDEGDGCYKSPLPEADFKELINEGFIRVAARDTYQGNFSEALRIAQRNKQGVDLPSEKYSKLIGEICKEENIYWWNEEVVSRMFTRKFKNALNDRLICRTHADPDNVTASLCELSEILKDKETITYKDVTTEFRKKHDEKSLEYLLVRDMLRSSYDYNVPEILKLDPANIFRHKLSAISDKKITDISPLTEQKMIDREISWPYRFSIDEVAELHATSLKFMWNSDEYKKYEEQMQKFRDGEVTEATIDELLVSIEKYLAHVNYVFDDIYRYKHPSRNTDNRVVLRSCFSGEHKILTAIDVMGYAVTGAGIYSSLESRDPTSLYLTLASIGLNVIRKVAEKRIEPPSYIGHAVIKVDRRGIPDGIPGTV